MGVYNKYGSINVGAYMAHQHGSHQPAFTDQYHPRWDRGGARGPRTWRDRHRWYSLWSFGCRASMGTGSGTDGEPFYNVAYKDLYEPYSCDGDGTSLNKFIKGITKDSGGTAISDVTVQAFRTVDDVYLGQDVSRTDGTYTCPTDVVAGTQCYLVAYKAGSPDIAGTTVNTITPTDVAGN
jgi:hypothetical protein